jgi:hypothetical protein
MLLQRHVASLGSACLIAQKNELLDQWHKLEARITTFEQQISVLMKLDDHTIWLTQDGKNTDVDSEPAEELGDVLDIYPEGWFTPEKEQITLPSALAHGEIEHLLLQSMAIVEAELHKGQVTDALNGLCLAIGEKSLCFRAEVQNVDSQQTTHQAWDKVHKYDAEAQKCRATYRYARSMLQWLPVENEYLETLHPITNNNLKVSGDLMDKRRFRQ